MGSRRNIAVPAAQVKFTGIINVIIVNWKSTDEDLFVLEGHWGLRVNMQVFERQEELTLRLCPQELRAGLISVNLYLSKIKVSGLI